MAFFAVFCIVGLLLTSKILRFICDGNSPLENSSQYPMNLLKTIYEIAHINIETDLNTSIFRKSKQIYSQDAYHNGLKCLKAN